MDIDIGSINFRCLCPFCMSNCSYICVSVNFVSMCVLLKIGFLACFYGRVPILCICPCVVSKHIRVCWDVACPGVPTTVYLMGEEVCGFYVYP